MFEYAKMDGEQVVAFTSYDTALPSEHPKLASGAIRPVVEENKQYNKNTHRRAGDPEIIVEPTRVVRRYPLRAVNADEVLDLIASKSSEIEAEFEQRWQSPIEHTVGGVAYQWHGDQGQVNNIQGIVTMILAGVPVPNPRPWTPIGRFTPVDVTHAELVGLGARIANRKDFLHAKKKAKQAAVAALTDPTEIAAYDAATGWE